MKVTIQIEDHGAKTVALTSDLEIGGKEKEQNTPTPAVVLGLAIRAMYENGMLARAGQIALEGMAQGHSPADAIAASYRETIDDNPNT